MKIIVRLIYWDKAGKDLTLGYYSIKFFLSDAQNCISFKLDIGHGKKQDLKYFLP